MTPELDSKSIAARCPRLVCVHGAGGGAWEWDIWRRVCAARGVALAAADLVAQREGIEATRFEHYVEQVRAACAADPAPYALVGASLGGLLALAADAAPVALVLINPLPPAGVTPRPPPRTYPARVR
jgi:pimeloyl-ACP methyl ester carboxylesterase